MQNNKNKTDMEKLVLKQEYVEAIRNDGILFGKVAYILDVKPVSLPYILNINSTKLTQASVLQVLRNHLGIYKDSDLLTEMPAVAQNT